MTDPAYLGTRLANGGPHEWGYRDLTDGLLIADDWPFHAATLITQLTARVSELEAGLLPFSERCEAGVRADDADSSGLTIRVKHLRHARALLKDTSHAE
jgi:hypothetical protein